MMMMAAASSTEEEGGGAMNKVMEKPSQEQIQQQQPPLKCPRCDSTNTKFCYYNNYSLTQPRHFCKACKRYWTRGGTLRSVPVGGGCRKNKRVRRPPSSFTPSTNSSSNTTSNSPNNNISEPSNTFNPQSLNPSSGIGGGGAHLISPFLYGLPTNLLPHHSNSSPHDYAIINGFPFPSYDSNHLGDLGLGFSSSAAGILGCGDHGGNRNINGYSNTPPPPPTTSATTTKQILQDLISNSNPTFHRSATTMSMSSLLNSSLQQQQQKFSFESLFPYELDLQIKGVGSHGNEGVNLEDGDQHPHGQCQIQNGYDHDQIHDHDHHQQQPMEESDPSMLWDSNNNNANGNSIGVNWFDPNNYSSIGSSSVPSLI